MGTDYTHGFIDMEGSSCQAPSGSVSTASGYGCITCSQNGIDKISKAAGVSAKVKGMLDGLKRLYLKKGVLMHCEDWQGVETVEMTIQQSVDSVVTEIENVLLDESSEQEPKLVTSNLLFTRSSSFGQRTDTAPQIQDEVEEVSAQLAELCETVGIDDLNDLELDKTLPKSPGLEFLSAPKSPGLCVKSSSFGKSDAPRSQTLPVADELLILPDLSKIAKWVPEPGSGCESPTVPPLLTPARSSFSRSPSPRKPVSATEHARDARTQTDGFSSIASERVSSFGRLPRSLSTPAAAPPSSPSQLIQDPSGVACQTEMQPLAFGNG